MTPDYLNTGVKASVVLKPERSQVLVILLGGIAAVSVFTGFVFLWHKHDLSWVPLLSAAVFTGLSLFAWNKSHRSADMANALPTIVEDDHTGLRVSVDPRALASPESFQLVEKVFSLIAHREPLPEPDGTVGASASDNPQPEGKAEAVEGVRLANEEASQLANDALVIFGGGQKVETIDQPYIDAPVSSVVEQTNAPAE